MGFNEMFDSRWRSDEIVHVKDGLGPSTLLVVMRNSRTPLAS